MPAIADLPRFEDDSISFDIGARNGYYTVGDRYFVWKIMAYAEAARTNQQVNWHFHEDIWRAVDWRTPPTLDLSSWYRIRAEQLRQRYGYIILAWSGGADSTNVLDTFLENDIRLDEVVITWAVRASQGRYTVSATDTSAENFGSEWDLAIRPRLEWMRLHRPDIKVTVVDWSDDIWIKDDSEDLLRISNAPNYTGYLRARAIHDLVTKRSDRVQNVVLVLGIEPAKTEIINHSYLGAFFVDWSAENRTSIGPDGVPRQCEYFYWTADLPEICVAQCHEMLRFLQAYPDMQRWISHTTLGRDGRFVDTHPGQGGLEPDRLIKKVLYYPTYDARIFQARKNTNYFQPDQYQWFYRDSQFGELNHTFGGVLDTFTRHLRPEDYRIRDGVKSSLAVKRSRPYVVGKLETAPDHIKDRSRYLKSYQIIRELLPLYI